MIDGEGSLPVSLNESSSPARSFWRGRRRPVIIAHRYGNSPDLVEPARRAGADILEADVWLHRGRLEVRHSKTLGPLPIIWDRWWIARRPGRPWQADQLLRATPRSLPIMFDLKGRNLALPGALIHAVRRDGGARPIIVCSPNWSLLEPFRAHPDISIVHSIGSEQALAAAWGALEDDWRDAVSIHNELLNDAIVARLKSLVDAVVTWPINTDEQLDRVLGFGVDGLTSDNLDLMERAATQRRDPSVTSEP
ncbi:MAG TPA: glycerophosphodiester phosphodiesterase [Thermomicrobiales bacterium]|nr:glycerophosphodiester phosphodiesterase [Thermomicrobiales bacterium]